MCTILQLLTSTTTAGWGPDHGGGRCVGALRKEYAEREKKKKRIFYSD